MNNPTQAIVTVVYKEETVKDKDTGNATEKTVAVCLDPKLVEAFLMSIAASNARAERYLQLQEAQEKRQQERHAADMNKRQAAVA